MGIQRQHLGLGSNVDGLTAATALGQASTATDAMAYPAFSWDMVTGLIPGSIGETSVIAIAIGAVILLWSGVASWKTMLSVFVGGAVMGWIFNTIGPDTAMAKMLGLNTCAWVVSASVPYLWLQTL